MGQKAKHGNVFLDFSRLMLFSKQSARKYRNGFYVSKIQKRKKKNSNCSLILLGATENNNNLKTS